jgi:hypothetical protein
MMDGGNPIAIVCSVCGTKDVSRDAWADWDERLQKWVLRQAFDDAHCHVCDGRTTLDEVPLVASDEQA